MKPHQSKRLRVFEMYQGHCAYCGGKLQDLVNFTLDHVEPQSKGGTWKYGNLMPACYNCNACKGDKTIEGFRQEILERLDPGFVQPLNASDRKIIKKDAKKGRDSYPRIRRQRTQPAHWLDTISKFQQPVRFFFEAMKDKATIPTSTDRLPQYVTMGGFGFSKPVLQWY
jgi:hypothetical protein